MNFIRIKHIHNTALLFILLAPFAIVYYALYVFNPMDAGNIYLYLLQLIADGIAIIIVGTLWLTILLDLIQPEYHKRNFHYHKEWISKHKIKVDVLIPVSDERYHIVENTIKKAVEMNYPHKVYVLDDGPSYVIKQLAEALKVQYIARLSEEKTFAKSGNLNYGLKYCKGDFFAVFDADHAPHPDFLNELLPFFENSKVALVQTPQHYVNTKNFIASGTAQAQEVFYTYVQPAKNSYNASFCVGTNMIYRRSAIDEIGGIALLDHSEDIWTTILLHEREYESIFYNKVLAEGRAPETIPSFFRQQNRWARGGFSLFFTHNPLFIPDLTIDQRLQYFFSNIHYFSAITILIYLVLPIIYLLFGVHSMNIDNGSSWIFHYFFYFVTVFFLPLFLLGNFRLATICTSLASFSPYLGALLSTALRSEYKWISTESQKNNYYVLMLDIWPHMFLIIISLLSVVVGWYNPKNVTTTFIASCWVLLNAYFLFTFIKKGLVRTLN